MLMQRSDKIKPSVRDREPLSEPQRVKKPYPLTAWRAWRRRGVTKHCVLPPKSAPCVDQSLNVYFYFPKVILKKEIVTH